MSFTALAWASKQKVGNSSEKLILMCLANYANDINKCYPSHKTICDFAEVKTQTVIRALQNLQSKEFINIEPRFEKTEHNKYRQTSNLYTLNIPPSQNEIGEGVKNTNGSPLKKEIRTYNNKPINYTEEYLDWWNLYPRKEGSKKKAFDLWLKIIDKELSIQELYDFTVKFKQSVSGQNEKYIPHATTWLNQKRWETVSEKNKEINLNQLVG